MTNALIDVHDRFQEQLRQAREQLDAKLCDGCGHWLHEGGRCTGDAEDSEAEACNCLRDARR